MIVGACETAVLPATSNLFPTARFECRRPNSTRHGPRLFYLPLAVLVARPRQQTQLLERVILAPASYKRKEKREKGKAS